MRNSLCWAASLSLLFAGCGSDDTSSKNDTSSGAATLIEVRDEPAGANCAAGGMAVVRGTDSDGNGTLSESEQTTIQYICTGGQGPQGPQGDQGQQGNEGEAGNPGTDCLLVSRGHCVGGNLQNTSLYDANLRGIDLTGADLRFADLREADFAGATLAGANLTGALLSGADFTEANLSNVIAAGVEFSGVGLSFANMKGAYLPGADLRNTYPAERVDFSGANLHGAAFGNAFGSVNCQNADLSGADLSYLTFSNQASLENANLQHASLSGTDFSFLTSANFDLTGAVYTNNTHFGTINATEKGAVGFVNEALLQGADLSYANLSDLGVYNVNLSGANLAGAVLDWTNCANCDLSGANLDGISGFYTYFLHDTFAAATLRDAYLVSTYFIDANITNANFAGSDFDSAGFYNSATGVADFSRASVGHANLLAVNAASNFAHAYYNSTTYFPSGANTANALNVDTPEANGDYAGLREYGLLWGGSRDLSGINLAGAELFSCGFNDSDLTGANLASLEASYGDWARSVLVGANLSNARLANIDLESANLANANLAGSNLLGSSLSGADLEGAVFQGTICPDGTNSDLNLGATCAGHTQLFSTLR